ncbi:hypothetical protein [Geothrix fuzhouensis]|uniref:hypothetical protein n=1 Tax=Geothrix fuzhouensis TaxID=2966451 RepID=UPI0021482C00|nr:hypothetical protein [Geothrix fuzhouensis]
MPPPRGEALDPFGRVRKHENPGGDFANASGNLLGAGIFAWSPLAGGMQELGYFNSDISGVLTNVAPLQ